MNTQEYIYGLIKIIFFYAISIFFIYSLIFVKFFETIMLHFAKFERVNIIIFYDRFYKKHYET